MSTTLAWVDHILAPYCQLKREELKLPPAFKAVILLDVWFGHRHPTVLAALKKNNIVPVRICRRDTKREGFREKELPRDTNFDKLSLTPSSV